VFQFGPVVYITTVYGGYVKRPNVTGVTYHFLVNNVPASRHGRFTIDRKSGRLTFNGTGLNSRTFNSTFVRTLSGFIKTSENS